MSGARPWLRSESIRSLSAGVGHGDHPALAGGQLLVGVEAEHGRVPAGADRDAVGVDRAQRLAGVLDDRQPEPLERRQVGRVAEDVDRQQRRGALGDRRRGRLGIQVQGHRVDVGEHRPRALVEDHVGAGHERERAGDHLVAVADAGRRAAPGAARRSRSTPRWRGPRPASSANARSNSASSGPSDRCPERSTSSTRSSSLAPRTGRASGIESVTTRELTAPPPSGLRDAVTAATAWRTRASRAAPPRRRRSRSPRPRSSPTPCRRRWSRSAPG